jgi:hypothetical protein
MVRDESKRMITLHTPWCYPYGIGVMLAVQRATPPLLGIGSDSDRFARMRQIVIGVGLWWLFVTLSVMWWVPPQREG